VLACDVTALSNPAACPLLGESGKIIKWLGRDAAGKLALADVIL